MAALIVTGESGAETIADNNTIYMNSSEVEIDSLTFFNVPLFIFQNEIQGKTVVKKNTSCFIWML